MATTTSRTRRKHLMMHPDESQLPESLENILQAPIL